MSGPLDGIRVLDLCDPKGQYMGRLLASHGADVIKVEPLAGDPGRRIGPFVDDLAGLIDLSSSTYFSKPFFPGVFLFCNLILGAARVYYGHANAFG